ncbi:MAG: DUF2062 domain-containing protein [Mariprofundaceae bacterium]|nr:DUF2062 domain-containing protein [Mariprofundaceae bacterium]
MPQRLLNKLMPDPEELRKHKCLRCFGSLIHRPYLWMLNRRTVAMAFAIGLFIAFVPLPGQMVMAAAGAVWFHGNLPVSVGLVWLTNPVTMPPIFYATYKLGTWVLQLPETPFHFEPDPAWFIDGFTTIMPPFLLGCFICAVVFSTLGYLFIRIVWRWRIINRWRTRVTPRSS